MTRFEKDELIAKALGKLRALETTVDTGVLSEINKKILNKATENLCMALFGKSCKDAGL